MTLQLPDVTLVCVETREHALACLAVEDCLKVATFGDVLIVTDRPDLFYDIPGDPRFYMVEDWPTKVGWSQSWWYDVPPLLKTEFTLNIQWDSWICDVTRWRDDFRNYDYIGAPWWYTDGLNVGNGGFSWVSTKLKKYLHAHMDEYPCWNASDDDLLCRKYRPRLEQAGFNWAPEDVAHDFAFECCRPSPLSHHFGFHAMFNWPYVLPVERLAERVLLASQSPYIKNGYMMKAFCQQHPTLASDILKNKQDFGAKHRVLGA